MTQGNKSTLPAFLLGGLLALLVFVSLFWIVIDRQQFHTVSSDSFSRIADIYQDGILYQRINLDQVTEEYTFDVIDQNGHCNQIAVRHGTIGIIYADCPDKLCVHQGFTDSSLLPIVCLPNRLVIRVHIDSSSDYGDPYQPDAVTY